jgi:ADP-heptose:LPS heptosyltransferase
MASVSHAPTATFFRNTGDRSGGKNSPRNRPMLRAASSDKNCAHCKSSDQKLATTSTNRPAANQQALQRASNRRGGSR